MKVFITIWADPAMYLATIFTARMLSERGFSVYLLYRTPNSHLNVVSDVDFGAMTIKLPVGGGYTGRLDKFD